MCVEAHSEEEARRILAGFRSMTVVSHQPGVHVTNPALAEDANLVSVSPRLDKPERRRNRT
ncbi:hypothetical protein [Planomonospora algeriensis]